MQHKKVIKFILNPISGTGKQKHIKELIDEYLDHSKFDYQIFETQYASHANELVLECLKTNTDAIIAIGGDGTINECFQALVGSSVKFGIIPTGSGNGLARHLKISRDLKSAIHIINEYHFIIMDTAILNDKPYINIAGVGFDAYVAKVFDEGSERGLLSYLKIILKSYISYPEKEYQLTYDDNNIKKKAFVISCANADQFGNNAWIAPQAKIDDGMLDVCVVKKIPFYKLPYFALLVLTKNIQKSKYYETFKVTNIGISAKHQLMTNVDGEAFRLDHHIDIKIKPNSLNIIVPKEIT